MKDLSSYRGRPYQFIGRFIAAYPYAHFGIGAAVVAAVFCSVSTQYGVKFLVDALAGSASQSMVWIGFALLAGLIAADNLLWRVASWIANTTFVDVSGAVRRTLFRYLTGHAPSYFQNQPPGALASRITATSNALYTGETMVTFNVLPPLIALPMAAMAILVGIVWTVDGWQKWRSLFIRPSEVQELFFYGFVLLYLVVLRRRLLALPPPGVLT